MNNPSPLIFSQPHCKVLNMFIPYKTMIGSPRDGVVAAVLRFLKEVCSALSGSLLWKVVGQNLRLSELKQYHIMNAH